MDTTQTSASFENFGLYENSGNIKQYDMSKHVPGLQKDGQPVTWAELFSVVLLAPYAEEKYEVKHARFLLAQQCQMKKPLALTFPQRCLLFELVGRFYAEPVIIGLAASFLE